MMDRQQQPARRLRAGIDAAEIGGIAGGKRIELVDRHIVLARGGAQGEQPLLDFFKLAWVVVGLPLHLSGEEGSQAGLARSFCAELEAMLSIPVETYDERLTSKMADATRRGGASASRDSIAAAHLLEAYLAGQAAIRERADD